MCRKGLYEEMVNKYGVACKFLPANIDTGETDLVFGENRKAIFDQALELKLFFETYDKYEGEGDIFNQFGVHFEDELVLWADKISADKISEGINEGIYPNG